DAKITNVECLNRPREGGKEILPVLSEGLSTDVRARRHHVENEEALVGDISSHNGVNVLGFVRRGKALFKRPNLRLVLRFRIGRSRHHWRGASDQQRTEDS